MKLKKLLDKIKVRIEYKIANHTSEGKIKYLRKRGCKIGITTHLNCSTKAFGTEPYLVEVGEECLFADHVKFFTHDGGVVVLNHLNKFDGVMMDKMARIKVGNNVYIGTGAYIMQGVTIGDNCVIGAGAVVTKDIPPNSCAVGVPAVVKSSLDEYLKRAKDRLYPTMAMSAEDKKKYLIENVK